MRWIILLVILASFEVAAAHPDNVVVLANPVDRELASGLFEFLENNGIGIAHTSASDFWQYKDKKFIVILGGPDALGGVGEIVREIIDEDEQNYLRVAGKKRMYVKGADGQIVCVIGGSDREKTREAGIVNQARLYQNYLNMEEDLTFISKRNFMVEHDLEGMDIYDKKVLEVMGRVPRQKFVREKDRLNAYNDNPLPIEEGQTISQPYVVALMTQSLELEGDEKVLEIGTGSGYQAAILGELVEEVYTIEIRENLADSARERLDDRGYANIQVKNADGYFGWEEYAPFDAIMITAAVNHIPSPLLKQLKDGGKLILPLGSPTYHQTLTLVEKDGNETKIRYVTYVSFVPMTGEAQK